MSQKVKPNNWTKWHPWNPMLKPETEEEIDWVISLQKNALSFHDRKACNKGDIVHQRLDKNKATISVIKYVCPECPVLAPTRRGLRIHIQKNHHFGKKDAEKMAVKARETIVTQTLPDVDLYYTVIKPRKILRLPRSVELDISTLIKKGSTSPTATERERHDREMVKWRKAMQTKERVDALERLPNGLFMDPGASGNWWYYVPNVWRQEANEGKGKWLEPTEGECLSWATLATPKRVLYLIGIIPNE